MFNILKTGVQYIDFLKIILFSKHYIQQITYNNNILSIKL